MGKTVVFTYEMMLLACEYQLGILILSAKVQKNSEIYSYFPKIIAFWCPKEIKSNQCGIASHSTFRQILSSQFGNLAIIWEKGIINQEYFKKIF